MATPFAASSGDVPPVESTPVLAVEGKSPSGLSDLELVSRALDLDPSMGLPPGLDAYDSEDPYCSYLGVVRQVEQVMGDTLEAKMKRACSTVLEAMLEFGRVSVPYLDAVIREDRELVQLLKRAGEPLFMSVDGVNNFVAILTRIQEGYDQVRIIIMLNNLICLLKEEIEAPRRAKVNFLVGLPASGKTTLLRDCVESGWVIEAHEQIEPYVTIDEYLGYKELDPYYEQFRLALRLSIEKQTEVYIDGGIWQKLISYLAYSGLDPRNDREREICRLFYICLASAMPCDWRLIWVQCDRTERLRRGMSDAETIPGALRKRIKPFAMSKNLEAHYALVCELLGDRVEIRDNTQGRVV